MTGNEIVKKVAKLRSIAYPELKSVATLDFDDYDKIIDTLAAEIFGSIEDAWDALDKVNTVELLSTIADTYHLPADLNLETADISFSLSAVTNIFYYLQWTNNITISKRNSYIKQAQLYNALNTMR